MLKKTNLLLILVFMLAVFLVGCNSNSETTNGENAGLENDTNSNSIEIADTLGRNIELNDTAKKVVAIGPGALRLFCYVGDTEDLSGVEQTEQKNSQGKPYAMVNQSIKDLQVIGPGGPNNAPDPEKLLVVKPDVIFTTYASEKSAVDDLQSKTGIPVISLSYGEVATFDSQVYKSIEIIGKVMGKEERADQVVNFMKECRIDLENRTKDITDDKKPSSYIGALSYKGRHGIESTSGNYSLFNAVNAANVVDETGVTGHIMIDKEKLLEWNPEKIFIDLNGLQMVKEDYDKKPEFYESLTAFKKGEVYSQLPYNSYSTNIGTSIANAYYIGKVLYPDNFSDVDIEAKSDEIYEFLLGEKIYSQMVDYCGGFGKINVLN